MRLTAYRGASLSSLLTVVVPVPSVPLFRRGMARAKLPRQGRPASRQPFAEPRWPGDGPSRTDLSSGAARVVLWHGHVGRVEYLGPGCLPQLDLVPQGLHLAVREAVRRHAPFVLDYDGVETS